MKTKETRSAPIAASSEGMVLEGYPVVYDVLTTIRTEDGGEFKEIIHKGALDGCDLRDSRLLYNHNEDKVPLARSGKTMVLEVTEKGLHMVATLASDNPTAQEVYSAVKRGDLSGMSFSFTVPDGGSVYDGATGTRHINKIARIYEVSICPFPAYPTASVEARDEMRAARDLARQDVAARLTRIDVLARATKLSYGRY